MRNLQPNWMLRTFLAVMLPAILAGPAMAQAGGEDCPHAAAHRGSPATGPGASHYAGEQARTVKALSADETAKLLAGHGMGVALAAELNHYPGPKHVLELASDLALTPAQIESTRAIFDAMKARAIGLGKKIFEAETELDRSFASRAIDDGSLTRMVLAIGELKGALRLVHLEAHLEMRGLMSPEQLRLYDELRGYADPAPDRS